VSGPHVWPQISGVVRRIHRLNNFTLCQSSVEQLHKACILFERGITLHQHRLGVNRDIQAYQRSPGQVHIWRTPAAPSDTVLASRAGGSFRVAQRGLAVWVRLAPRPRAGKQIRSLRVQARSGDGILHKTYSVTLACVSESPNLWVRVP
jgi:hypothetical protein